MTGWQKATFPIAMPSGPTLVTGWAKDGLGLHTARFHGGRENPDFYTLTHLGSGHGVATISGPLNHARTVANRIAKVTDWTFKALPRAGSGKIHVLRLAVEKAIAVDFDTMLGTGTGDRSHKIAREVAAVLA